MTKNLITFAVLVASISVMTSLQIASAADFKLGRREFIVGTSALALSPMLGGPLTTRSLNPTEETRALALMRATLAGTMTAPGGTHPLRELLYQTFWPQPGQTWAQTYVFWFHHTDAIPDVLLPRLQSVAKDIIAVQDKLAAEFNIPLERIQIEMPDILRPQFNTAIWMDDYIPDPNPRSLGFEFHQAFYRELEKTQPSLVAQLREQAKRRAEINPVWGPRFRGPDALGRYIELTGERLSLSGHQVERLRVALMEQETQNATTAEVVGRGHVDAELRALIEWARKSKTDFRLPPPKLTVSKLNRQASNLIASRPTSDISRNKSCRDIFL